MQNEIRRTLHSVKITANYRGAHQLAACVLRAAENEDCLLSVTREIYQPVAEQFGCNVETVERNIRTVIHHAWRGRRKILEEMAGFPLDAPPTVSQMIEILANHVNSQRIVK